MLTSDQQITALLHAWRAGDASALADLTEAVYDELRRLAARRLKAEAVGHTLQPTELVHEAFVRLARSEVDWKDRVHFFAIVASTMRRVLVDHARAKHRKKRGANPIRVTLNDSAYSSDSAPEVDFLDLDQALTELTRLDPEQVRLESIYFTGLTLEEISEATGVSKSSAHRLLRSARAWIHHRLSLTSSPGRPGSGS